mmetsp:Transcript_24820/g.78480  ORF Transcript_24820/g.78480 Transcript_24820/m.78480 type:complete len:302 (+) Transcript_24820:3440-4345(+)
MEVGRAKVDSRLAEVVHVHLRPELGGGRVAVPQLRSTPPRGGHGERAVLPPPPRLAVAEPIVRAHPAPGAPTRAEGGRPALEARAVRHAVAREASAAWGRAAPRPPRTLLLWGLDTRPLHPAGGRALVERADILYCHARVAAGAAPLHKTRETHAFSEHEVLREGRGIFEDRLAPLGRGDVEAPPHHVVSQGGHERGALLEAGARGDPHVAARALGGVLVGEAAGRGRLDGAVRAGAPDGTLAPPRLLVAVAVGGAALRTLARQSRRELPSEHVIHVELDLIHLGIAPYPRAPLPQSLAAG